MPKVTDAHLEARRQQILEAASACFARKGFHHSTMQDICAEAGLSPGAVYRYFSSKEEIIQAMAEESRRRSTALIEAVQEKEDTRAVIEELSQAFFGWLEEGGCEHDVRLTVELWAEALRNPQVMELLRHTLDSHREPFTGLIRKAQRRGEINPRLDPAAAARVMISFYEGLLLQMAVDPKADVGKYVAVVKAMMSGDFWTGGKKQS